MKNKIKDYFSILKETYKEWNDSNAMRDSASLAYYAIFSIPGLLIIIIWVAGLLFKDFNLQELISTEIGSAVGKDSAKSIEDMLQKSYVDKDNFWMKAIGVGGLIFGATTLFFQLQISLNQLWDVKAKPKQAFSKLILDRANSLGMILIIGFLLLITMLLSTFIGLANDWISNHFGVETLYLVRALNLVVGFVVVMILFALMFKVLPDVEISWRSVWAGSFLTTILFTIGKFALSSYFSNFKPTSTFGAAGSVILIMMWINYTCVLIFFGVVFTKVYTYRKGLRIRPSKHAEWLPDRKWSSPHDELPY